MKEISFSHMCSWLRFRHLVLIDTLVRTQNMHTAAEMMHISQPAVSKMLREIENQLGFMLFTRLARSITLTDLGAHVARYARIALNDAQHFVGEISHLKQGGHGVLKVGVIFAATSTVLPGTIIRIKQRWPLLSLEVQEGISATLLSMLEYKQLDLVIARYTLESHAHLFDFRPIGPEPLCLVVGQQHSLASAHQVTLDQLACWPWIVYPAGTPLRARYDQVFADAKVKRPENTVETSSIRTILELLLNAPMVTLMADSMAAPEIRAGNLVRLPFQTPIVLADYGVITRRNETPSWSALAFIDDLFYGLNKL